MNQINLNRRDFLKAASVGAASAIALSCNWVRPVAGNDHASVQKDAPALVIGAGMAGLAAARTLADKNINAIVIEARHRIGGRMWTDSSLGVPLDLGASWIHGVDNNPITALAKKFNAKTIPTDDTNGVVFHADGREMTYAEYLHIENLFEAIHAAAEEIGEQADEDMPLQQAFDMALAKRNLSAHDLRGLNLYIQYETSLEYGADPKDLSLWEWNQDETFGGREVIFPQGYTQITDGLANGLDIRLNTKANLIRYDGDGVEVETSAGVFTAEKAIVTIPLGVLKRADVKFEPPLPPSKQEAIDRLAMGVLNKVCLKFPRVFWDEEIENISYAGEEQGKWCYWLNYAPFVGAPILTAFHGGSEGFALEKLANDEIIAGAMKTLRVMFGDDIPEPENYLITRWGQDPFSYGAYSHIPPFAKGDDYDALFEAVGGVLFFAGEATSKKYPATVHGAYLSGVAAASHRAFRRSEQAFYRYI